MLAGIIGFAASYNGDMLHIKIENPMVAAKCAGLIKSVCGTRDFSFTPPAKTGGSYSIKITDHEDIEHIAGELTFLHDDSIQMYPDKSIIKKECCKGSFIAGAFLGGGSASDPQKNYHLEFVTRCAPLSDLLTEIFEELYFNSKLTVRKNDFVVYIKDSETIAELIGLMGAGSVMMDMLNLKIERELRNNVNRQCNCDSANADKITLAAERHMAAINKLRLAGALSSLPEHLYEIAVLRAENQDISLKELGQMLKVPIGKSGVNHRLNKLVELADKLK